MTWYPQRHVDYAAMEQAAAEWRYGVLHKDRPFHDGSFTAWSERRSMEFPYHFNDGVRIWPARTDVSPHDDFLGDEAASPVVPPDTPAV